MRKLVIIFFLIVALIIPVIRDINAVTIYSPLIEIKADPGEVITEKIKLKADKGEGESIYYPSKADFTAKGEGGEPAFLEPTEEKRTYSLASWIEIDDSPFTLKEEEIKEIPFTIRIPKDAEPGGHYGAIFFSSQPPEVEKEAIAIGVVGKIGALILVRVSGAIKEEGRIVEFAAVEGRFSNRLPINFITRFENTGNIHLKPQGEIKIKNIFGKEVAKLLVNEEGGNALPEKIRKFTTMWQKENGSILERGLLKELRNEKRNFALGRYTAYLNLVSYGEAVKSIWIFPWRLILAYIIVLIIIIILFRYLLRSYNQWIIRKQK